MLLPPYMKQAVRGPGAVSRYLGDVGDLAPIFVRSDQRGAFAKAKLFRLLLNDICGGDTVDDVMGDSDEVAAGAERVATGDVPPSQSAPGGWAIPAAQAAQILNDNPNLIPYVEQASGLFSDVYGSMLQKIERLPFIYPGRIVLSFPDGYKWVTCDADEAHEEGALMSHCGVPSADATMYSLRDKSNLPHITLELNSSNVVTQVSGKGNSEPNQKYLPYIEAFKKQMGAIETGEVHWDPEHEALPEAQPIEVEEVTEMPKGSPNWPAPIPVQADVNIVDEYEVAKGKPEPNDFQLPWGGNYPGDTELGPDSNDSSKGVTQKQPRTGDIRAEYQGLPLVIEWEKGDIREGENTEGEKWKREMHADYGYITDSEGEDGDGVDVYVGPDNSEKVFVVTQLRDGEYDEDKCMIGFSSADAAEHAYRQHYPNNGDDHFGGIEEIPLDDFLTKYMAKKSTKKKRHKKASSNRNYEFTNQKGEVVGGTMNAALSGQSEGKPYAAYFTPPEEPRISQFVGNFKTPEEASKAVFAIRKTWLAKWRETHKTASPAGNNLLEIDQGVPRTNEDSMSEFDNIDSGKTNTSEGGDPSMKFGSSDKEEAVGAPYGHLVGPESNYMDKDHKMNITMFAKVDKGEDPYEEGVIYGYDDLLVQHQKDVIANWGDQREDGGKGFLWLRTNMKTADILSESARWYHKNRNKKWKLEDRDKVLHLANLIMDGATITPLMVSPKGEPKGGCWEGYHRLATADMLQIKCLPVIMKIDPADLDWQEKVAQHERQPWAAIDLDGTILVEDGEHHEGRPPLGEPYPGAKEALQELVDAGVRVSIWTARQYFEDDDRDNSDWQAEIDEHLKYHQIPYTDIYVGKKPPADVFIDNKSVAFKENWPQALQEAVQHLDKKAITMEAVTSEEAAITMDAVDDPAMFGNNDDKADANVRGDGSGTSLNGPAQWTSDVAQGPLSGA